MRRAASTHDRMFSASLSVGMMTETRSGVGCQGSAEAAGCRCPQELLSLLCTDVLIPAYLTSHPTPQSAVETPRRVAFRPVGHRRPRVCPNVRTQTR